jgi:hypothetical protein
METSVLQRLETLEKQNRRLKRAGLVAMVLAGGMLLIGQAKPQVQWKVEAERFSSSRTRTGRYEQSLAWRGTGHTSLSTTRQGRGARF